LICVNQPLAFSLKFDQSPFEPHFLPPVFTAQSADWGMCCHFSLDNTNCFIDGSCRRLSIIIRFAPEPDGLQRVPVILHVLARDGRERLGAGAFEKKAHMAEESSQSIASCGNGWLEYLSFLMKRWTTDNGRGGHLL
jgi:hypothetical protein